MISRADSGRITIHAPCDQLQDTVATVMRLKPDVVEFAGFDPADARIAPTAEMLKATGHTVVVTSSQQGKQSQ